MNNKIENELNIKNNINIENKQKNFLESTLGKVINTGIDLGIRTILPNYIEDQVIDLKNNLIEYGLKEGIKKSIDDAINIGKSTIGIFTGNFENISQAQQAIKSGGILDNVSDLLNDIINKVYENGLINYGIANTIKQGKNVILKNIERNIEETFSNQIKSLSYLDKYANNWKECFDNKDFYGMEREYQKIENKIKDIIPIEKTINDIRKIENLHNLIKNNGHNFNLTEYEIDLSSKLK